MRIRAPRNQRVSYKNIPKRKRFSQKNVISQPLKPQKIKVEKPKIEVEKSKKKKRGKKWIPKNQKVSFKNEKVKLKSGWLEYGYYKNGILKLSIGGKLYDFGKFPFVLWKKIALANSAGKKIWNTIWKHKRKGI